jgi:hypothetical protein
MAPSPSFELTTDEHIACGASAPLPYTPANCGTLSRIEMQALLHQSTLAGGDDSGNVTVYEYGKAAAPSSSAADAVQTLTLRMAP